MRSRNWELQVQFRVSGTTKDLFGDGFAIWYTRDRMESGPVFGNRDYFSGLAIIADTYSNHNGPHNVRYFESFGRCVRFSELNIMGSNPTEIITSG